MMIYDRYFLTTKIIFFYKNILDMENPLILLLLVAAASGVSILKGIIIYYTKLFHHLIHLLY